MTYVLGYSTVSGKKAQLGTVVHKVMEVLAGCKKLLQDGDELLLEDDAIGEVEFTKRRLTVPHTALLTIQTPITSFATSLLGKH